MPEAIAGVRKISRALTIGVDIRALDLMSSRKRGIGRYLTSLIPGLASLAPQHRFKLYGVRPPWRLDGLRALINTGNVEYCHYHPTLADALDVFLLTDPLPVLAGVPLTPYPLYDTPKTVILYDLIPLAYENAYLASSPLIQREYHEKLDWLVKNSDRFLPISDFVGIELKNRLGVESSRIRPIYGGVDDALFQSSPDPKDVNVVLNRLGIGNSYFLYSGGFDFRKNLPMLIRSFAAARRSSKTDISLVLAGEDGEKWKKEHADLLNGEGVTDNVLAVGFVSDDDLRTLYAGAVALTFVSLYEGLGLPALEAMACGCPVISADGSALREIAEGASLLVNPLNQHEISAAMVRMLRDDHLVNQLKSAGRERAKQYTWTRTARLTLEALESVARHERRPIAPRRRMQVMIQNRANAAAAPGGDTVVMEQLFEGLRARDVEVHCAEPGADLSGIDLVHVVNLTLSPFARSAADSATAQRRPYVITTLFEDWPLYMEKSNGAVALFRDYLETGRDESRFRRGIAALQALRSNLRVGNADVAANAAALLACGNSEAERLQECYPEAADRVHTVRFGILPVAEVSEVAVRQIRESLGADRYIICCGRLETRKNQLMLLKALENSDIPIILASGGFSYQRVYVNLVNQFKRKGPVIVLGRVNDYTMAALMKGAAAHVLPSWYELPGLVSLEAAAAGTAVVASEWGALQDYLPQPSIQWCRPDDPESIASAVERALRSGPNPLATNAARSVSWEHFSDETYDIYERILSRTNQIRTTERIKLDEYSEDLHRPEAAMRNISKPSMRYDVSIIVPLFNRSDLTRECVEALSECRDSATYEVVFVDNHSTDDTQDLLQAIEGDVKVLREPENRGFAAACNDGARLADGEYLVFLNNDTRPQSGWLDALVTCARENTGAGAIGARLLYPSGDVQHAGLAISEKRIPYHVFQHFPSEDPAVMEQRDMKAVTAACVLVPKSVFEDMAGFDTSYRNGFEDVDFCLRLWEKGRRVIYCPLAKVIHHEESTEGRKDHDAENLNRFTSIWGGKLLPDERELLSRHGYQISWGENGGTYSRISSGKVTSVVSADADLKMAQQFYETGKVEAAAEILQKIVENKMTLAGDEQFETWQTLGNCLARLNRAEDAENAFLEAHKVNEHSERPYLGLGAVGMLKENWHAAQYGFMAALARNPGTTKGEFGVGLSLAARNMHSRAVEHFAKVVNAEPYNAEALLSLYRSAMECGTPDAAIEPLENFLDRFPEDTNMLFSLCGAYWKAGRLTNAVATCERLLEMEPHHAAARDVMNHLKESLPMNV